MAMRVIVLGETANIACEVAAGSRSESDEASYVHEAVKRPPMQARSATAWIAVTILAMTWASQTQSSPDHIHGPAGAQFALGCCNFESIARYDDLRALPLARGGTDKSARISQATTGNERRPPGQEYRWGEAFLLELENARRDIELLQRLEQEHDRAERLEQALAAVRREVETQTALADRAREEASRLKREGDSGTAEVERQERERSAQLAQDLAATRREVEIQAALARKASEEASRLKQASESSEAELQTSLQQERARSARLEHDLAVARRDVEVQTALAVKASEEAAGLKQAIVSSEAEQQRSSQQERQRAARLEQDLAATRREVETQTALAAKANGQLSQLKEASERSGADHQVLQQERERSARLEHDLAAARREVETQTVLAAKANEQVSQLKKESESSSANQQKSLQQERARAARLEQDLSAARRDVETQTTQTAKATSEVLRSKQAAEADAAELRQSIQKERKKAEALGQELSITRSAIYAYEAQAAELRQAAANGGPLLRKSMQDERARAARLEQELATARRDLDMQVALAAKASDEAARMMQAAERDAASLRSSLDQERAKAEQLERALALAKQQAPSVTSIGLAARDRATENGKSVADRPPAARVLSEAQPQSNKAAAAALLARARALLEQGDIGAARIVLERAIEMGSVQASFSLAETYDPVVLAKWGALGTRGDAARAQDLYAKADAAGIKEAKARIEALRR